MATLNIPVRKRRDAEDLRNEIVQAGQKAGEAASLAGQMLFGEDTGSSIGEDLAYGAVPGGSLFQRAMTGTMPGLLDYVDVVPGVGAGLKFAMTPIALAFSRDLLKGGRARLGKTAKNIAETREARDYIHRVHRTRSKNEASIDKYGLLAGNSNKNYGKNTGDTYAYPPSVWLGFDPTNVPVLQYYYTAGPTTRKELATYRVRIPRGVYNNTPRVKFEGDRSGTPRVVGKGESSITNETARRTGNKALIDVFSSSIPPEWLSKIPKDEFERLVQKRDDREKLTDLYNKFYGDMDSEPSVHDLSRFKEFIESKPSLEARTKPMLIGLPMEPISEELSESIATHNAVDKLKHMPSPSIKLRELLNRDNIQITKPEGGLFNTWKDIIESANKDIGVAEGSVSRGHTFDDQFGGMQFPTTRERNYDWNTYRKKVEAGLSPAIAHEISMPKYTVDFSDLSVKPNPSVGLSPYERSLLGIKDEGAYRGAISRPMEQQDWSVSRHISDLMNSIKDTPEGFDFMATEDLHRLLSTIDNPSIYLERLAKTRHKRLKDITGDLIFHTNRGHIARGVDAGPIIDKNPYGNKNWLLKVQEMKREHPVAWYGPNSTLPKVISNGIKQLMNEGSDDRMAQPILKLRDIYNK